MSDDTNKPIQKLPDAPNLDWLRKQAKRRLKALRQTNAAARLSEAQFDLAKDYGFSSWRALKVHIDAIGVDAQLFGAARSGAVNQLDRLLTKYPDKLHTREKPYDWSLLHFAARSGHLDAVSLLLRRGLSPDTRETGDNTYPMHWAAAAGALDVVRRLADAGGDVMGRGDDHGLEVIGWATCWENCDDDDHRTVADFLVSRGATHHIFSAIAMNLDSEVRRIVEGDPASLARRQSRNDNSRTPLHFAVMKNRPDMVALLLDLGADPLAIDGAGQPVAAYTTSSTTDRGVMEQIRAMTAAELTSAGRGSRAPRCGPIDLVSTITLADWNTAAQLLHAAPDLIAPAKGALHLLAKRNDAAGVKWLLEHGADPNGRWAHWDAEVTALHLAAAQGHKDVVQLLLEAGADPAIRDSKHNGDAAGWAMQHARSDIVEMLKNGAAPS